MAKAPRRSRTAGEFHSAHATHIVLFRQVSEANTSFVRQALNAKAVPGVRSEMGVMEFASADTGAYAGVYEELGIAAIAADSGQVAQLQENPAVEEIFVNEERRIPEPVAGTAAEPSSAVEMPGLDYLTGLKDGLELALASLTGRHGLPVPPTQAPSMSRIEGGNLTWGLRSVGISEGYRYSGRDVPLAVLDTGIDLNHPDFKGRVVEGDTARSFVPGQSVQDGNGHGTHCCGTAAGPKRSIGGIRYGVAPEARLLVGKVLSDSGSGWDDQIIDGIQWAVSRGARVISMSLGSTRGQNEPYNRLYERVAERLLESKPGTLLVAAAGNGSRRPSFTRPVENPAACPSILAVAAVDSNLAIARFSCRQMDGVGAVEVSAPGVDVLSAVTGGGFARFNGTSMATPHIAGISALYLEAKPELTATEVWDRVVANARPLGDPADFGAGLAQAPQATGGA